MKQLFLLPSTALLCAACAVSQPMSSTVPLGYEPSPEPPLTQSLFADKNATISEENIQKILTSSYRLPGSLRVALMRLDNAATSRRYWADEQYVKAQQAYTDQFTAQLRQSSHVAKVTVLPELLLAGTPTFTSLREAAVRTQADVAVVYSVTSDLYSTYRLFAKAEVKAFATTQLLVLDTRTGLIPFSATVTREAQSTRQPDELNSSETASRVKREAALRSLEEIGRQAAAFLTGS